MKTWKVTLLVAVIVVGAVEVRGKVANRVRLQVTPDASGTNLLPFVSNNIAPGSTIMTDEWQGYSRLE